MESMDVLTKARESMDARTVYAEPVTQNGVIVIPAAKVSGGAGGGSGKSGGGEEATGQGGGFGVRSTPIGAFVIKDGKVAWRPALDLNKVILSGQIVAIVALLSARAIVRTLERHRAS
jgi:uncharacterized spore protein YtfJ